MSYEFEPCDSSTKLILETLAAKSAEGVSVQVVIDNYPFTQKLTLSQQQGLAAFMKQSRIDFRIYNDAFIFLQNNHRNHIKFLIVDPMLKSGSYIIGGRNMTDSFFGLDAKLNFRDQDLLIAGASVQKAQAAYDTVIENASLSEPRAAASASAFMSTCLKKSKRDVSVQKAFATPSIVDGLPSYSCSNVSVVADNPKFQDAGLGNDRDRDSPQEEYMNELRLKRKSATKQVLDFIAGSKRLISENQFYLPVYKLKSALRKLRDSKDHREVIVFTNRTGDAEELTDAMTAMIVRAARKDTAGNQVVVPVSGLGSLHDNNALSYKNANWRIHTKSAVRNSTDVLMSSFNFDPRSYHTNLESSVVIKNCPSLAKAVESTILSLKTVYTTDLKNCAACKSEVDIDFGDYLNGFLLGNFL